MRQPCAPNDLTTGLGRAEKGFARFLQAFKRAEMRGRLMLETAIIGGGLCGLSLTKNLHRRGRDFALFEARDRLGGRISPSLARGQA